MAKKKRRADRRPRPEKVATSRYTDPEGNSLVLRDELSPGTIAKIKEGVDRQAYSVDDVWQRRAELIFERLAVSWEIAGLPLDDQKMLLGRYRMGTPDERRWVREAIDTHIQKHIPELA